MPDTQGIAQRAAESLYRLAVTQSSGTTRTLSSNPASSSGADPITGAPSSNTSLPTGKITNSKFQAGFLEKVKKISSDLGIDYRDLLIVMAFETGGSFSPSKRPPINKKTGKPISSAIGLIQFLSKTAENLGTSTEALGKMTQVQQLDWVYRYLNPYKGKMRYGNFGDVYLAVFSPKFIGKPDSFICYRRGQEEYRRNSGLDTNNDGLMTREEIWSKAYKSGKKHLGWD